MSKPYPNPYPVASMNKSPDTPQLGAYYRFKGDDYYCSSQYLLYTGAARGGYSYYSTHRTEKPWFLSTLFTGYTWVLLLFKLR